MLGRLLQDAMASSAPKEDALSIEAERLYQQAMTLKLEALPSSDRDTILDHLEQLRVNVDQIDQLSSAVENRLQSLVASKPGLFSRQASKDRWALQVSFAREQLTIVREKQSHIHLMRDEVAQHLNDVAQNAPRVLLQSKDAPLMMNQAEIARMAHHKFLAQNRGKEVEIDGFANEGKTELNKSRTGSRRLSVQKER